MSRKLNSTDYAIQLKQGLSANVNSTANNDSSVEGEMAYTTDSKQLYIHDGASFKQAGLSRTSSASDPSTTELPASGDASIHKNTSSGDVFLAYNDGGSIVKVQLS